MKASFVGIGPGKSGSTWLYLTLKEHPQVCMAKVKETDYFTDHYARGEGWYHKLYERQNGYLAGEISNTYIFSSEAAVRIFAYNPEMKIISILRDPIERAVSHYLFLVRNGMKFKGMSEATAKRPDLLERGLYSMHLEAYLSRFPREQMFIGLFDDLKENANSFAAHVFDFLDIRQIEIDAEEKNVLRASVPRNRYLSMLTKKAATIARTHGFPVVVEKVKRTRIASKLYKRVEYNVPEIIGECRDDLVTYYQDDIKRCSDIVGVDLEKKWLSKYSEK